MNKSNALHSLICLGDRFDIRSGLLEITYDTGAKVILQGPVTYEVESVAGGYLSIGKLTARLEKSTTQGVRSTEKAASASPFVQQSFAIRTPTAIVTDLGTEFGVEVDDKGCTASRVFRGVVELRTISLVGDVGKEVKVLYANESARVDVSSGNRRIAAVSNPASLSFVRVISATRIKTLDLVDIVAGGDGSSGRRNRGIDPTTGQIIGWPVGRLGHFPEGDGKYHPIRTVPAIDGVFVPDGRKGPVRLDSAGHTFDGFVNNTNWVGRYLWAGGPIAQAQVELSPKISTRLNDIDYASAGHGYLLVVANTGITFDLSAIRRANFGCKSMRFCAVVGNTEPESINSRGSARADFHVFIDGHERFKRREINGCSGSLMISTPIGENDRFLTLATTDSGNGIISDDILLGDPRLELLPLQQTKSQ